MVLKNRTPKNHIPKKVRKFGYPFVWSYRRMSVDGGFQGTGPPHI